MVETLMLSLYDFDGTLYRGDATRDFFWYCLGRYRRDICKLPYQALLLALWSAGLIRTEYLKQTMLHVARTAHLERLVADFWSHHQSNIFPWVSDALAEDKAQKHLRVCISASPEFLLKLMTESLGVDVLIGTRMANGVIIGKNCKGPEKVVRLKKWAGNRPFKVIKMVSDTMVDGPLYQLAEQKFWVNRCGTLLPGMPRR